MQLDQKDLSRFSESAKQKLREEADEFVDNVISESRRIEAGINSGENDVEITGYIVERAARIYSDIPVKKRKSAAHYIVEIGAIVLPAVWGVYYSETALEDHPVQLAALSAAAAGFIVAKVVKGVEF